MMVKDNLNKVIGLSIVIPVYNEEESVKLLYERIKNAVRNVSSGYEIIFVDDGSQDNTINKLLELHASDDRVKVIKLRKNYGQTAAMSAGFDYSTGKVVISMDGDLQNDPDDIPRLLERIDDGYDVVCGWRKKRRDKLISRKVPSIVANYLIGLLTGVKIHDNGCSLKAFRANIIKNIHLYSEMHRFIPAMAAISGAKITEIIVNHHARRFGATKYGISRAWRVFLDLFIIKMLVGFASRPARCFALISFPFLAAALFFFVLAFFSYVGSSSNISSFIVYPTVSFLLFSLVFQLNALGYFGELVLRTGHSPRIESVDEIK